MGDEPQRGLVLFVQGLWLHADMWCRWADEFDANGYDSLCFHWPQVTGTSPTSRLSMLNELTKLAAAQRRRPVVVGYGFGGALAERLLVRGLATAAISVAPVPGGTAAVASGLQLARHPWDMARLAARKGPVRPTCAQSVRSFGSELDAQEAGDLHQEFVVAGHLWPQLRSVIRNRTAKAPSAGWPDGRRGPLLLAGGGSDRVVHEASINALHRRYRRNYPESVTDFKVFPLVGHSLVVDHSWQAVAFYCLDWLTANNV